MKQLVFPFPLSIVLIAPAISAQNPDARAVGVMQARSEAIERTSELQAEVFPFESAKLVPRVTGQVATVFVEEGDEVEQGAQLDALDCPDLIAELAIAESLQR